MFPEQPIIYVDKDDFICNTIVLRILNPVHKGLCMNSFNPGYSVHMCVCECVCMNTHLTEIPLNEWSYKAPSPLPTNWYTG